MSPRIRIATLIRLLLERPHGLAELRATLGVDDSTLYRDLETLRAAGWQWEHQGRPKSVWIPR